MLKAKDIADRWGVSLVTVYNLFNSGQLPGLRISPKNIRFRLEDIEAYERQQWNTTPSTSSSSSEESSLYTGETSEDDPAVSRLVRQIGIVLNEDSRTSSEPLTFGGVPILER